MDLTLLRSFVAVAESGSFSAAAARLHLTQSSISHQIARLESDLGRRLFERTTRSCTLTASGRLLLEQAGDLVQRFDDVERQFRPESLRGHLRVGVPDDPHLFSAFALAMDQFAREQPLVTLDIQAGMTADLRDGLKSGDLDLAIVREVPARASNECILSEDLIWVAKAGTTWRSNQPLPIALVCEPCAYRRTALRVLEEAGIEYRNVISCSSLVAVLAFVETGMAVSIVIRGMLSHASAALAPVKHLPPLPSAALVFRHRGARPTALARELMVRLQHAIQTSAA